MLVSVAIGLYILKLLVSVARAIYLIDMVDMVILGFTSDGEFNSLRWKGNTRPLTVLQVKTEARAKYQNKGLKTLLEMLHESSRSVY